MNTNIPNSVIVGVTKKYLNHYSVESLIQGLYVLNGCCDLSKIREMKGKINELENKKKIYLNNRIKELIENNPNLDIKDTISDLIARDIKIIEINYAIDAVKNKIKRFISNYEMSIKIIEDVDEVNKNINTNLGVSIISNLNAGDDYYIITGSSCINERITNTGQPYNVYVIYDENMKDDYKQVRELFYKMIDTINANSQEDIAEIENNEK